MASRRRRGSSKSDQPSYTAKRKYLRKYYQVPSGRLTPPIKGWLTRKYREVRSIEKASSLKFHPLPPDKLDKLDKSRYITTPKGAFLAQRKGETAEVGENFIKLKSSTAAVNREQYEFPLTDEQVSQFVSDPAAFVRMLARDNPRVFKPRAKLRRHFKIVYGLGAQSEEWTMHRLEAYLRAVRDVPIRSTKKNIDRLTKKQRRERFERTATALRVIFFKPSRKHARRKA